MYIYFIILVLCIGGILKIYFYNKNFSQNNVDNINSILNKKHIIIKKFNKSIIIVSCGIKFHVCNKGKNMIIYANNLWSDKDIANCIIKKKGLYKNE